MRHHQPELSTSAESVVDNVGHERAINPFGELFHQAIHYLSMSLQIQYRGVVKAFGDTHIVHHFEASFQLIYRQKKDIFLVDDLVSADLKIAVALRNLDNPLLLLRRIDITILQRHEASILSFFSIVFQSGDKTLLVVLVAGINLSQINSQKDKVFRQAFLQGFYYIMFVFCGEWLTVNNLFNKIVIHLDSTPSRNRYTFQFAIQEADTIAVPENPIRGFLTSLLSNFIGYLPAKTDVRVA